MKELTYNVKDEIGIHARPAGLIASTAKKYSCDIEMGFNGKTVKATKIMAIMGLGVKNGDMITFTFTGDDEEQAYNEMFDVLDKNL